MKHGLQTIRNMEEFMVAEWGRNGAESRCFGFCMILYGHGCV